MDPKPAQSAPATDKPVRAVSGQLGSRFDYVKYDEPSIVAQNELKVLFTGVEAAVEKHMPLGSRAKAMILTKLEEAYMWCGKAIRDAQIQREGSAEMQEERKNA